MGSLDAKTADKQKLSAPTSFTSIAMTRVVQQVVKGSLDENTAYKQKLSVSTCSTLVR